jgi:hypothetical protein
MHYKRVQKHGTPEYRWGGKVVGRPCLHCERPVRAREMCNRHYLMWLTRGDALYADQRKQADLPPGTHLRKGYRVVTPPAQITTPKPAGAATVEKWDRPHALTGHAPLDVRSKSGRRVYRQWEHRTVAGAEAGEIVHHIDGDRLHNDPSNLCVFADATAHGRAHRSLELIAYRLYRLGLVAFDQETGTYLLNEQLIDAFPTTQQLSK